MNNQFDNEELDKTGVNLGPSGKLALMAKLAEGTGIVIPQQTLDAISASAKANEMMEQKHHHHQHNNIIESSSSEQHATQCFLLSNMFDLAE